MPKTRQQKEELVKKLTEELGRANSIVFADYRGLTMTQLSEIRKKLREQQAEFTITKNNLLKLAIHDLRLTMNDERLFEGPIATLFSFNDEVSPIKTLVKSFKEFGLGKVKGGFLGDEYLVDLKINSFANLPSKQELQAKTVGVLVAPLQGIVRVLQGNLRNLVYALSEIQKLRGGESS